MPSIFGIDTMQSLLRLLARCPAGHDENADVNRAARLAIALASAQIAMSNTEPSSERTKSARTFQVCLP